LKNSDKWADLFGSEWPWVQRLGKAISDPEEKRVFWETVRDKKLADPSYSMYEDFPMADSSGRKRIAMKYSHEILQMLRGRGNAEKSDRDADREEVPLVPESSGSGDGL